jgi:oxygen-independent coproporphyrinogen-3 oxidase
MTRYETTWSEVTPFLTEAMARLEPMVMDGLVQLLPMGVKVTETGRPFLRNICMAFDAQYWRKQPEGKLFSQAV